MFPSMHIRIALRKKTFSRELCGAERGVILYNMLYSLARLLNIIYSVEKNMNPDYILYLVVP